MSDCPFCSTPLPGDQAARKGFAFCDKCSAPRFTGDLTSPFEVLGAPRSFDLDERALETHYYELSRRLHPDRFASKPALKIRSQELAAAINQAYFALKAPEPRLEALLRSAGALEQSERQATQAQLPAELAEEYFELQEALAEGGSEAPKLVAAFRAKVEALRASLTGSIHEEARAVRWETAQAADPRVQKILEMRRQRSYVRSMLENLERRSA